MSAQRSAAYQRIERMFAEDQCVMLDGGVATELQRVGIKDHPLSDKDLWGTGDESGQVGAGVKLAT